MIFPLLFAVAAAAAPSPVIVVAIGDSTTAGTPFFRSPLESPPDGDGDGSAPYPAVLQKLRPQWRVLNDGVNGQRSDEIRARFEHDAIAAKPRAVVILAGVNDIYQGRPLPAVEADLLWMYRRAVGAHIVPVAATVMPFTLATAQQSSQIHTLNAWIKKTARAEKIPFVDFHAAVGSKENPDALSGSPEGLHPDRAGYRAAAEAVAPILDRILTKKVD